MRLLFDGARHVTKCNLSVDNTLSSSVSLRRLCSKTRSIGARIGGEYGLLCGCAAATAIVVGGAVVASDAEANHALDTPYLRCSPDSVCLSASRSELLIFDRLLMQVKCLFGDQRKMDEFKWLHESNPEVC